LGRSRAEVIELLGQPDSEPSGGRYMTHGVKDATPGEYTLNFVYILHVDFDGQGRVTKAFI
jgi:hypothetical protein